MVSERWTPNPDFNRLRTALLRRGEPDRVPRHDNVDVFLKKRFLGIDAVELTRGARRMQAGARLPLEAAVQFAYRRTTTTCRSAPARTPASRAPRPSSGRSTPLSATSTRSAAGQRGPGHHHWPAGVRRTAAIPAR